MQQTHFGINPADDLFYLGVKIILKNSENKILLLQMKKDNEIFWELPGGRVQKGETEQQALLRELREEIGTSIVNDMKHMCMQVGNFRCHRSQGHDVGYIFSIFSGSLHDGVITLSSDHVAYQWQTADQAKLLLKNAYGDLKI